MITQDDLKTVNELSRKLDFINKLIADYDNDRIQTHFGLMDKYIGDNKPSYSISTPMSTKRFEHDFPQISKNIQICAQAYLHAEKKDLEKQLKKFIKE